jgi:hypothetical protein
MTNKHGLNVQHNRQVQNSSSGSKNQFVAFSPNNQGTVMFNQMMAQKQQSLPRIHNAIGVAMTKKVSSNS